MRVGLHDEIFQGNRPVLAGIDSSWIYCYLLKAVDKRNADTWGVHLLDASAQRLDPDYTIADAGVRLRAGQSAAWGGKPCHGDVFHIRQQCEAVANVLAQRAKGFASQRDILESAMARARLDGDGRPLSQALGHARQAETRAREVCRDVKTLIGWFAHDVLSLAGPELQERRELFDFIVEQLRLREPLAASRIRPLRVTLRN